MNMREPSDSKLLAKGTPLMNFNISSFTRCIHEMARDVEGYRLTVLIVASSSACSSVHEMTSAICTEESPKSPVSFVLGLA